MLPYAAYLRVYEPLSAFPDPDRSHWAGYAASADRPRRVATLEAEHVEAIRRVIAVPPIVAPAHESGHAYVRQADGVTYICPWQTRLRSWLALGRLRATLPPPLTDTFVPRRVAEVAAADFARWHARGPSMRTHILTATWHVPLAWFVPFGPPERWLVLGGGAGGDGGPSSAAQTRALIYVTTMSQARRRVARALGAVRHSLSRSAYPYGHDLPGGDGRDGGARRGSDHRSGFQHAGPGQPGPSEHGPGQQHGPGPGQQHGPGLGQQQGHSPGQPGPGPAQHGGSGPGQHAAPGPGQHGSRGRHAGPGQPAGASGLGGASGHAAGRRTVPVLPSGPTAEAAGEIEEVGRWLAEFHPRALVELDYGGLVYLLDDESLRADQSVAEVAAAITGLETGELELAVAMYQRLRTRWRALEAAESAC